MRTSFVKNGLAVGVILLFVGVAVQPSIIADVSIEPENFNRIFPFKYEVINRTEEDKCRRDFDLEANIISWWSPYPEIEEKEMRSFQALVYRHGFYKTTETHLIHIKIFWKYFDHEELIYYEIKPYYDGLYFLYTYTMFGETWEEKPLQARIEVECLIPEKNKENNVKTVDVGLGVTIDGYVYSRTIFGEKTPEILKKVICLSERSHFWDIYFGTFTLPQDPLNDDGHYRIFAPMKTGNPPHKYIVQANYENKEPRPHSLIGKLLQFFPNAFPILRYKLIGPYKRKVTKPLNAFEYYKIEDMVFLKLNDKIII